MTTFRDAELRITIAVLPGSGPFDLWPNIEPMGGVYNHPESEAESIQIGESAEIGSLLGSPSSNSPTEIDGAVKHNPVNPAAEFLGLRAHGASISVSQAHLLLRTTVDDVVLGPMEPSVLKTLDCSRHFRSRSHRHRQIRHEHFDAQHLQVHQTANDLPEQPDMLLALRSLRLGPPRFRKARCDDTWPMVTPHYQLRLEAPKLATAILSRSISYRSYG
ncbi:hypothetical protein CPLU01_12756 [Colletotrichum plurivorum]|uniref:Uncharacterized protein n=1 Tax=Colletotrichum plurivorum TaxID=2175906 RepID=A0A8H6JWG3_9PEZI|nr:hypothetical protein CPLU01_12756 [Colletotrichum plurivorum]